jgi:DNA-binding GntR family transcriptional regulator
MYSFQLLTASFSDRVKRAYGKRWMIISALRDWDTEKAQRLMAEHIENTLQHGIED